MNSYKELNQCPKCQESRFVGAFETEDVFRCTYHKSPVIDDVCQPEGEEDADLLRTEHLHITCSRCKYDWLESPADKKYE
jgi:predicted nucleic-acid-binding Zn-ribbon protein